MGEAHVVPRGDLVKHEESDGCVCGPHCEFVPGGRMVIHHALDGREHDEER